MSVQTYNRAYLVQMIRPTLIVSARKRSRRESLFAPSDDIVQAKLDEFYTLSCSNHLEELY